MTSDDSLVNGARFKHKVLILCQYYYPEYVSSALLPTQLSQELAKLDVNVDVICGEPKEYYSGNVVTRTEVHNGVCIQRVKYSTFNNKKKLGRIFNFFSFFTSVLLQIVKIKKYDVIIVYSNPPVLPLIGYWAHRLWKSKFIFVGFDLYPDNAIALKAIKDGGLIDKLMRYINGKVYATATKVVAISDDMERYILSKYPWMPKNRVNVIPNWYTGAIGNQQVVVGEEFRALRSRWNLIVLYTGNMGEAQDLDTIVSGIIKLKEMNPQPDILFVFTGHGSRSLEIQDRLAKDGVNNVKFYGFLTGQDYEDILNISDVCMVSLKSEIEGLGVPSKTYGYFAYGKPVLAIMSIATELATNIVQYSAGACVPQGDVTGFKDAIIRFKNEPEFIQEAQRGSVKIHNELYQKDISISRYCRLVGEILEESREQNV